jgi:hypothetical protein
MTRAEAILAARKMKAAGQFHRKIVARVPDDMHYDKFQLACGHHLLLLPALVRDTDEALGCRDCMEDWVKTHSESESTAR